MPAPRHQIRQSRQGASATTHAGDALRDHPVGFVASARLAMALRAARYCRVMPVASVYSSERGVTTMPFFEAQEFIGK